MSWVRLDDNFYDHPAVAALDDTAFRLHVSALCYCARHLTDGRIAFDVPYTCNRSVSKRTVRRAVSTLVDAGLWVWAEGGFAIPNYLDYNPDAASVKESRRLKAERQHRWKTRKQARGDASSNASQTKRGDASPNPTPIGGVKEPTPPMESQSPATGVAEPAPPSPEFLEFAERFDKQHRERIARKAEAA